jgi:hypothetical protein
MFLKDLKINEYEQLRDIAYTEAKVLEEHLARPCWELSEESDGDLSEAYYKLYQKVKNRIWRIYARKMSLIDRIELDNSLGRIR